MDNNIKYNFIINLLLDMISSRYFSSIELNENDEGHKLYLFHYYEIVLNNFKTFCHKIKKSR